MPGVSYKMVGYQAGRFVRFILMTVLLCISVMAVLFMGAISLRLLVFSSQSIINGQWQMAWFASVGTFVCAVASYLYGEMVPQILKEMRRPNIHPVVPLARGD